MWMTILAIIPKLLTSWRAGVGIASVVMLLLSYVKGRGDAWTQAELNAKKQWQQRVEAVTKLNEEYRLEIVAMLQENQELQDKVETLNEEASKDPDANNKSLGVNSVRRLNKIK